MSDEQASMTARELRARGWELTQESMLLVGMFIPECIHFRIDGCNYEQATRVAQLDELALAIDAVGEDIRRLIRARRP